jgi:dUTP pyrophosphatase
MKVKIWKKRNDIITPVYKTEGAAGMDVHADLNEAMLTLFPHTVYKIPTGIHMEIPKGYYMKVVPRSGMASKGITVVNSPGTIDHDYRGEVFILLLNETKDPIEINNGDRIAQFILSTYSICEWESVNSLSELEPTVRGAGGFGSTGSK